MQTKVFSKLNTLDLSLVFGFYSSIHFTVAPNISKLKYEAIGAEQSSFECFSFSTLAYIRAWLQIEKVILNYCHTKV